MAAYFLKILSGPHLGAEVLLREGRQVIGSAEDCDILLDDGSVAARHLALEVSPEGIRLAAMEDVVYVEGEKAEPGDAPLLPYRIVTIGTTHFGVGLSGERWPPFDLPAIRGPRRPPEGTEAPPGRETGESPSGGDRGKRRTVSAILAAALPVLVLAMFSLREIPLPPEARASPAGPAEALDGVRRVLGNLGLGGVEASVLEDGRMEVRGFVETAGEKRRLAGALRPFRTGPAPLLLRVAVNGRMVEDCRAILGSLGLRLDVESPGPGTVVLTGRAPDGDLLNRGIALLHQDLPALRDVENRVVVPPWPVVEAVAAVPGSDGEPFRPALPVLSVSLGPAPCVSLAGGKKFFEGARWEEGTFIKAIGPDGVLLTREEGTVHLIEGGEP
jgi:type III secretion system YscD/HrpQ family protein